VITGTANKTYHLLPYECTGEKDLNIEVKKISEALGAEVIVGKDSLDTKITNIYASDLMSDVLAYGKSGSLLLTGLNTIQVAISSYMAEIKAIVFLRGKIPGEDIRKFAEGKGIIILSTNADMYEACIKIARTNGHLLTSGKALMPGEGEDNVTRHQFSIDGKDFASAGLVSTQIKSVLKKIGYNLKLVRRIAISTYEAEMNVVMHALRAKVFLTASDREISVVIDDEGKGIPDIDKAMQPGFSTATEEQRAMGFGAGMGLPNIKKNTHDLKVSSVVGKGTRVEMKFFVKPEDEK
jgi:anti-sigma regulatory factor (Ser/Thr protein kinase)